MALLAKEVSGMNDNRAKLAKKKIIDCTDCEECGGLPVLDTRQRARILNWSSDHPGVLGLRGGRMRRAPSPG